METDPILQELYDIRAGLAKEYGGLKGLHKHALEVQSALRVRRVPIVNLHKASAVLNKRTLKAKNGQPAIPVFKK